MGKPTQIPVGRLQFKEGREPVVPLDLLDSIQLKGIINPLLVLRGSDGLHVYIGNQRLAAARKLGIGAVPCVFVNSQEEVEAELGRYRDP